MDKRFGKLTHLARIPTWIFLILFIISASVSLYALRQNNKHMIVLRNAVYAADKNNGNVNAALDNLKSYVFAHMNTNLSAGNGAIKPPIQLQYTYERLVQAQASSSDSANSQIYTDAENYCQAAIPASVSISGRGRISCVQDYITSHGGSTVQAIPKALYEFDFVSPAWSPDLAGWSLVISALLLIATAISFLIGRLVDARLKPL